MKKVSSLLLVLSLFFTMLTPLQVLAAEKPIEVYLNGEKLSFPIDPIAENGTTLVPFRVIFEKLGMTVFWDDDSKQVKAYKDWLNIVFTPGSKKVFVNGFEHEFAVASKAINGTTLVPLRFVSEAAGKTVNWDGNTRTITINDTVLEEDIKVTDSEKIYDKLMNLEINSLDFNAEIYSEDDDGFAVNVFLEGKTMKQPSSTTHIFGETEVYNFDYGFTMYTDVEIFTAGNSMYMTNPFTGEWEAYNNETTGFEGYLIDFLPQDWNSSIKELKSDLSYEGLILEIYFDPTLIKSNLTESPIVELNYYYILDPKTFYPKEIILELIEEVEEDFYKYTEFYFTINSINEITEIPVPKDLKPLIS